MIHATATLLQSLSLAATAATPSAPAAGPLWALLIPGLPLIGFALAALCAVGKVKSKLPAWLSVACLGGAFATTVALYLQYFGNGEGTILISTAFDWINVKWGSGEGQQLTANFSFYLDSLTVLWMLFVTGLATLIALYASEYMSHDVGMGYCRFFAAFCLFVFSMACLVMADNLLLLYLGWEGVGLCSYLLIGYFYKKPSAVEAAKKAFIVNRIGDLFLALGIFLTFVHFGSVEYAVIFAKAAPYIAALQAGELEKIPAVVQLIPMLLMVGAFGKSAQLPLYVWLPDAMEGPTPVSALIHAATMVTAGVFLIARTYPLFLLSEHALPIVGWVGALTALFSATIGMAQFDIKRIMAYSTVSQLGYMFAGLAVLTSTGGAAHVFTHAFFKAMLFLSCGAVMHGFAGQLDLRKLSGVGKMKGWKVVNIAMLVGCLNLAGFPIITAGYWSKDMILGEAFANPHTVAIGWILLLTAGLTAYYTFRVYFRVFMGPKAFEPGDELHAAHDDHGRDSHANSHGHTDAKSHDAHGQSDSDSHS
ncbi:MAG: NADH-quinone oxidoreductase subunit L, partial [bacterium]|nr:NADH-quinone oxidoreductase subunit L [bacterium]